MPRNLTSGVVAALCATALGLAACGGDDDKSPAPRAALAPAPGPVAPASAGPAYAPTPASTATAPAPARKGRNIGSSGFDIKTDSFAFENYTTSRGPSMRAQEVQELFGAAVCVDPGASACVLTPAAERWRLMQNAAYTGGHCYGFSTLSLAMRRDPALSATYGAATTHALRIADSRRNVINPELDADLTRDAAMQTLASILRKTRRYTPTETVAALRKAFASDDRDYVLSFYFPGEGGHAVVPIALEDMGDGKFDILLYDNNHPYIPGRPASSERRMQIDTKSDRWEYNLSTNPNIPETQWSGEGRKNPLLLDRAADQVRPQPCPFCDDEVSLRGQIVAPARTTVALTGAADRHGHLRITDGQGRVTGWNGTRNVNEIPGAQIREQRTVQRERLSPEPYYELPPGRSYTVTLVDVPAGAPPGTIHASGRGIGVGLSRLTSSGASLKLGADGAVGVLDAGDGARIGAKVELPQLRVAADGNREITLSPDADKVMVRPAAGDDVRISGRVRDAEVLDAATGKTAALPSAGGRVDIGALVGSQR